MDAIQANQILKAGKIAQRKLNEMRAMQEEMLKAQQEAQAAEQTQTQE